MKKSTLNRRLCVAIGGVICLTFIGASTVASANEVDEVATACKDAARLIQEEDDLEGAIEEAKWCLTGLRQLQEEIKLSLLPDELAGFKGGEIDNESLMGINVIMRKYTRNTDTITVSLNTTNPEGSGGPLAALGDLGKLFGAMEGANNAAMGGKKIRIQKRTAMVLDDGGNGIVNIELKSGGTLKAESSELGSDELVDFMREFPIAELDDAMAM